MTETKTSTELADLAGREAILTNAEPVTDPPSPATSAKVRQLLEIVMQTGLTGRQLLLPAAEAPLYASLVADYQKQFEPVGPEETALVQSIIDLRWRLNRFAGLESALLDLGRRRMLRIKPAMADNPAPALEVQVRLQFAKEFRDFRLEERQLARRRDREMQELVALQSARKAQETKPQEAAPATATAAQPENGFVFSTSQLIQFLGTLTPQQQQEFMLEIIRSMPETADPNDTRQAVA